MEVANGIEGGRTCNALPCPMLQTNPVILPVGNFLARGATVEDSLRLAGNRLREVSQSVPLATLL